MSFSLIWIIAYGIALNCGIGQIHGSENETTGSEPISETTPIEPEAEDRSTAEPSIEPEAESTVEPEPEGTTTNQPEAEATVVSVENATAESSVEPLDGTTGEPEPESVTSEPEAEANSEPAAEGTSEATSEPEVEPSFEPGTETAAAELTGETSEPETGTVEPVAEVTSEPFSESTSEPEAEANSEPAAESSSEPAAEPASEAEPESISEPETEVNAEPAVETTSGPEPEGVNPIVEPTSESGSEPAAYAEQRPSASEIILPPFALILVILAGLLGLLMKTHGCCLKGAFGNRRKTQSIITVEENIGVENIFFSPFDREVLDCLLSSNNRIAELLKISTPALLSLALCPLTLYLYTPFSTFLWPPEENSSIPNINDAIACFLSPAGLVYATSFGFAFQQALNKQHEILTKMTNEISMIDQMATFTSKLKVKVNSLRLDIYRAIKAEGIFTVLQILNREPHSFKEIPPEDVKVRIWSIVDTLRAVETDSSNHVNRILVNNMMDHIMALNSICSDRMGILHTRIHPVKWAFLETLGFSSFMGVLLLRAYSYRMELVMCIVTVFSISLLCYVVSDLDSPFSGFFRVDLSIILDVLKRVEKMHNKVLEEDDGERLHKLRSKLFKVTR